MIRCFSMTLEGSKGTPGNLGKNSNPQLLSSAAACKSKSTSLKLNYVVNNWCIKTVLYFNQSNLQTSLSFLTRGPRATVCSPEWHSHCRHADVMQHFSNPIIATNENIIIWAVLSFEEKNIWAWQSMEHDHLNKLSITFQQKDQCEIWWKLAKWFLKNHDFIHVNSTVAGKYYKYKPDDGHLRFPIRTILTTVDLQVTSILSIYMYMAHTNREANLTLEAKRSNVNIEPSFEQFW